jgi:hypothetical protein
MFLSMGIIVINMLNWNLSLFITRQISNLLDYGKLCTSDILVFQTPLILLELLFILNLNGNHSVRVYP